jgi:hypothetical protein
VKHVEPQRRAFVLQFQAEPGVDEIKALRTLLKFAGRRLGLRCVDVRECAALPAQEDERARGSTQETAMSAFSERIRSQKTGAFKAADFAGGKEVTLTVDHLEEEVEKFDKKIDILHFVETQQELQLNQSKSEFLLNAFGDDPEKWKGQRVTLYQVEYPNVTDEKYRYGIGVKLRAEAVPERPTRSSSAGNGSKSDDMGEIPF